MDVEGDKGNDFVEISGTNVEKGSSSCLTEPETSSDMQNQRRENQKDEIKHTLPFYKLFSFADSTDVILMILGTLGALGNGISMPLMTVLFGNMIQSFGGAADNHDVVNRVKKVSLEFVYLGIAMAVLSFLQVFCWIATGERQSARIRNLYLKTILSQEIAFFDKETSTGEVVGRMSGDTILIQDAMGEKVGKFIQLMSTFFGGFIIAFTRGWLLAFVMLSTIPPLVVAGAVMAKLVAKMASLGQEAYGDASKIVEQTIGSIRTVASFTGESLAVKGYNKSLLTAYKASVREGLVSGLSLGLVYFIMDCGYSLGVWYGGKLILKKNYDGGDVLTVIFSVVTGSFSLGQVAPCISAFAAGQAAAFKMFETIHRKPEINAYDANGKILDDIQGDVELRDVYFSYPTRPDELIFRGFSLSIQRGSSIALVGESGSGKSTVINLIERFYDPQAGEVLIDNINLKEFQLQWIRRKIGLVSQEPILFTTSIKDNIAYGQDDATFEQIRGAAELANAMKFIDKLPQGFDTMVGEHGTQLSGGQKQRIAIARAILKDPRILLLDEATSALDAESEHIVQEALDRVMENRTTIVVAHRLSTIRNVEIIAVIHRGSIVEKGSHTELLKDPNGAFSQLIRLQEMNHDMSKKALSNPDERMSSHYSISRGSSIGHDGRTSFQQALGSSVTVDAKVPDTKAPKGKLKEIPVRRLAYLNKPEVPVLLLGSVAAIIDGCILPFFGVILSNSINAFYQPPHKLRKDTSFWAIMFLVSAVVSLIANPARTYFYGLAGSKLVRRIRFMTFEKVINMEMEWFDNPVNSSGAIGARLSADAATVRSLVGDALALIVQNITTLIAGLLIAFISSWQLSLIVVALIPLLGLNGWIQIKVMKGFSADAKSLYEEASQVATDAVGSIRTVASFSAEEKVTDTYKKKCEGPMRKGIKQGVIGGVGLGFSFFLLCCSYAVCFYAGARLVDDGKTTFGKVFRVLFALAMTSIGISQSSSLAPDSSKARTATASVFAILDRKSKIDPSSDSGIVIEGLKGNIEFRHVSFRYPARPDVQVFQDLCLVIHSGKTVALVGESGSGKSTAISLMQRFYDPDSGHILLDAVEINKLKLKWLRQQMGLVSQEPSLFNDTIRANIAYGKEGHATEAEVIAAAELANAHKFISSLQQGYDTVVGERGIQLSGGQKQRVAIARAIIKEPKILLLDEATSALDAESEKVVQDALDKIIIKRTTVVVAHRLSTIKGADLIAVVKNGMIVEKGKHETLINIKDGAYASLISLHMSAST